QARAALRYLRRQPFVDGRRLAVFGFSVGGWAALSVAAQEPALSAVVAVAPAGGVEMIGPHNRERIARLSRPLRVRSVDWLTADFRRAVRRFDPHAAAARRSCPLLLVHGDADEMVPDSVSRTLFAEARPPKRLVVAGGAAHDFLDRRDWLVRLTAGWLERRLGR
ncbi:MAG: prolyl oligopeptidase family serine peptidase, partial [Elusimicrobia bacterium]|nr:prolyl oligopeptidase family serine peptidase [Elusimicrobiota bacterium]